MGISQFPAPSGGGGVTNDFILDKNNTINTSFAMGRAFEAGGYSVVVTGSTAYDIYLLDADGSAVGYTNGTSIVASQAFESVVALGLGTADTVAFGYNGPSTNATTTGTDTGAGPFLTSISPSDLPVVDDTTIVSGGNFASGVEFSFISGTSVLPAKNVVVGSSTAAVVTRPDALSEDDSPYDIKAVNPGVPDSTGSNANILAGTVTAGTDPSFVTTSPILGAQPSVAFSTAILTSDSEGTVVDWQVVAGTLPSGLALATATGVISGTPSAAGDYYFTVQITDDGNNSATQEYNLPVGIKVVGGTVTTDGSYNYFTFLSTDTIEILNSNSGAAEFEYLAIAGGGGGGGISNNAARYGGGGAGGLLVGTASGVTDGTYTVTIGAGGAVGANGSDTSLGTAIVVTGGGKGGENAVGGDGGSGGGGDVAGTAVSGQGFDGGISNGEGGGGGGGAGAVGGNSDGTTGGNGGDGIQLTAWSSAIGLDFDGGYFAGGGGGGGTGTGTGGLGGGGNGGRYQGGGSTPGDANSGGGGGGGDRRPGYSGKDDGDPGGSGLFVVRTVA